MKLETESIMPKSCIVAAGLGLELCYLASCSKLHKNIYQWLAKKTYIKTRYFSNLGSEQEATYPHKQIKYFYMIRY